MIPTQKSGLNSAVSFGCSDFREEEERERKERHGTKLTNYGREIQYIYDVQ